jgi:hypothetical protein
VLDSETAGLKTAVYYKAGMEDKEKWGKDEIS